MDWSQGIVEREPISRGGRSHPRVICLHYRSGKKLILKVGKTPETARCEAEALRALSRVDAPVPALVDYHPEGILVMDHIPGTALGNLPQVESIPSIPALISALSELDQDWQEVRTELEPLATPQPRGSFIREMRVLGQWLCPQAPHPESAAEAWKQVVELAGAASQTFGSLDYNPHNIIATQKQFFFCDFESFGMDWPQRRLWQYTTLIRDHEGNPCWHPLLRDHFIGDPAYDAHYILFCAAAAKRRSQHKRADLPLPAMWGRRGGGHPATVTWRKAWVA